MKFRCERDVLVEALATAGRAASSRGARCRCCQGSGSSSPATRLRLTGSDLDLTITTEIEVVGEAPTASPCCPRKLAADIVRSLEGRCGRRRGRRRRGPHQRRAARSSRLHAIPADEFPQPGRARRRAGHARPLRTSPRACARSCGRVDRRVPADPHRRAAGRRGRRAAPGRHRLVPARRPRPARHRRCSSEGQNVLVPVARAQRARPRALPAPRTSRCSSASATRRSRSAALHAHHPPDRGRVPELPRPHPARRSRTG